MWKVEICPVSRGFTLHLGMAQWKGACLDCTRSGLNPQHQESKIKPLQTIQETKSFDPKPGNEWEQAYEFVVEE